MMIAAPIAMLFLLVPLGFVAATVWLWVRVVRGFTARVSDSATCGACGAGVRGIGTLDCPECGADLREVGIVTQQKRRAMSVVAFALGWTLLPLVPSLVALGLLTAIGPSHSTSTFRVTITEGPNQLIVAGRFTGPPVTGGTSTQSSSSSVNGRRTAQTTLGLPLSPVSLPERLYVKIVTPSGATELTHASAANAFVVAGHPGLSGSPALTLPVSAADVGAVLPLAAGGRLALSNDQLDGVASLLNGVAAGQPTITVSGWGGGASSGFGSSTRPSAWYLAALLAVFGLVYLAGYVAYFRLAAAAKRLESRTAPALAV